jgi:hypothetical protein
MNRINQQKLKYSHSNDCSEGFPMTIEYCDYFLFKNILK